MSRTKRTAFCLAMAILFVFSMLMLGMGVWRTHAEGTQIVDDLTGFTMVHEKSNLTTGTENGAATFKPATDATAYAVYKAPSAEGFVDFTVKFWSTGAQGDYEWRADTEGSLKAEIAISADGASYTNVDCDRAYSSAGSDTYVTFTPKEAIAEGSAKYVKLNIALDAEKGAPAGWMLQIAGVELTYTGEAVEEELPYDIPEGSRLYVYDDAASLDAIAKMDGNFALDTKDSQTYKGYKRENSGESGEIASDSIVNSMYFEFEKEITSFAIRTVHTDGLSGYDFSKASGNNIITVEMSDTLEGEYLSVPVKTKDIGAEEDFWVLPEADIPAGMTCVKITIGKGGIPWNPIFKDLYWYAEPTQTVDECEDFSKVDSSENMIFDGNIMPETKATGSVTYMSESENGFSSFEAKLYLDCGQGGYDWRANAEKSLLFNVYGSHDGKAYAKIGTDVRFETVEEKDYGIFTPTDGVDYGTKYLKFEIQFTGAGAPETWDYQLDRVALTEYMASPQDFVEAEDIVVTNAENSFTAGESLAFTAEIQPGNASYKQIYWRVYDSAALDKESEIAYFADGVLYDRDYRGKENVTLYVVAGCGTLTSEPFTVTLNRRPDDTSVTITNDTESLEGLAIGGELTLTATVEPENAISKEVSYELFADEKCTQPSDIARIDGNKLTAVKNGTAYLRAVSAAGNTDVVKIVISGDYVTVHDDATDLNNLYGLTDLSKVAVDANNGIKRYGEGFVGHLYYKSYADIKAFRVQTLLYDKFNAEEPDYDGIGDGFNEWWYFQVAISVSADAKEWTYIKSGYTVAQPPAGTTPFGDYTMLTFFNAGEIPAGMRFVKIDLVGACTVEGRDSYTGVPFPERDDGLGYEDITEFRNTWAPFVRNVEIYADADSPIDNVITNIEITNTAQESSLRTDESLQIKANIIESAGENAGLPVPLTDFSKVDIVFTAGGDYVSVSETGLLTIKDNYPGSGNISFYLASKEDEYVRSSVYTIYPFVSVDKVTLSSAKDTISLDENMALTVTLEPSSALVSVEEWIITVVGGGNASDFVTISDRLILTPKRTCTIKIAAVVDGVTSNEITINIVEKTQITITSSSKTNVGETLELTVSVTPEYAAALPVSWQIVEGSDFAELDGNKLIAKAVGVVKVRATVNGKSAEMSIVISAAEPEGPQETGGGCSGTVQGVSFAVGAAALLGGTVAAIVMKRKKVNKD